MGGGIGFGWVSGRFKLEGRGLVFIPKFYVTVTALVATGTLHACENGY